MKAALCAFALLLGPNARAQAVAPEAIQRELWVRRAAVVGVEAGELLARLSSADWTQRHDALDALARGAQVAERAAELGARVLALLCDPHPSVRAMAVQAAHEQDLAFDAAHARALCSDPFSAVRLAAVRLFGRDVEGRGDSLFALTQDADPRVREEARAELFACGPAEGAWKLAAFDAALLGSESWTYADALLLLARSPRDPDFLVALRERIPEGAVERAAYEGLCAVQLVPYAPAALVEGWCERVRSRLGADERIGLLFDLAARVADEELRRELLDALELVARHGAGEQRASARIAERWPALHDALQPDEEEGAGEVAAELASELLDAALEATHGFEPELIARLYALPPGLATEAWRALVGRVPAFEPESLADWLAPEREGELRAAVLEVAAAALRAWGDAASGDALAALLAAGSTPLAKAAFESLCAAPSPLAWEGGLHASWRERPIPERVALLRKLPRGVALPSFRSDLIALWESAAAREPAVLELLGLFAGDPELAARLERWLEAELAHLELAPRSLEPGAAPLEPALAPAWLEAEPRAKALVSTFARVAGDGAIAALERWLARTDGRSAEVAKTCAALLAQTAEGRARLCAWMRPDASSRVRIEAALACVEDEPERAIPLLLERYPSCDQELRLRTLRVFGGSSDVRAAAWLAEVARTSSQGSPERTVAFAELARGRSPRAPSLLADLFHTARDLELERQALAAIAELGAPESIPLLLGLLDDDGGSELARDEGLLVLARIAPVEAVSRLLRAPLARAREDLAARLAGRRLSAPEFQYRGELSAGEQLATAGLLGEALARAPSWWELDPRLALALARRATRSGDPASARHLLTLARVALEGEPHTGETESLLATTHAARLQLALDPLDPATAAHASRSLLALLRPRHPSPRLIESLLGPSDLQRGQDPLAWLEATALQSAAQLALTRGNLPRARRLAALAFPRIGRSRLAERQQLELDGQARPSPDPR